MLSNVLANLLRSIGRSREAGLGIILGGLLNIALDPLFMFAHAVPAQQAFWHVRPGLVPGRSGYPDRDFVLCYLPQIQTKALRKGGRFLENARLPFLEKNLTKLSIMSRL